jgi:hypothetical protein
MKVKGSVGDRLILESERVGQPNREGEILEIRPVGDVVRYRVRWADGHESTIMPTAGSVRIVSEGKKSKSKS